MVTNHPKRQLTALGLILLLLTAASPLAAQSLFESAVEGENGSAQEGETPASPGMELRPLLDARAAGSLLWDADEPVWSSTVYPGLEGSGGQWGRAKVVGRFDIDENGSSVRGDLEEARVDLYLGPVDLELGRRRILWGRADGINPTGRFHQQDRLAFSLDPDESYLPEWMVRGRWFFSFGYLEGIWNPEYRFAEAPLAPAGIETADPSRDQWGAKLDLQMGGWEGSFSFFYGPDAAAGFKDLLSPAPVLYAPVITVVGADFSTAVGAFGLRGEGAFSWCEENSSAAHIPSREVEAVLGIDGSAGSYFTWLVQANGTYVFDWSDQTDPAAAMNALIYDQTEEILFGSMVKLTGLFFHDTLQIDLAGNLRWTTEDYMVFGSISWNPAAGTELYAVLRHAWGAAGGRADGLAPFYNGIQLGVRSEW